MIAILFALLRCTCMSAACTCAGYTETICVEGTSKQVDEMMSAEAESGDQGDRDTGEMRGRFHKCFEG